MSKFCSQCGAMMDDAQMFCGVCGNGAPAPQQAPQYEAPQQAPQYGAPQYGAPQQAPQYGAPQYGAPQQAPQYGAPQYGAPQYGVPQYGVPQYGAPQKNSFFSQIDWKGILSGKAPMIQNCLAALAVQVLSLIFFFLPMLSIKAKAYGYSAKASYGIFGASSGAGVLVPIFALLVLLGSVAFLLLPVLQKKEIKPLNVLVFFAGQAVYFLTIVIAVIIKMISGSKSIGGYGFSISTSCTITIGFIFFALFTLAAMFVSGRVVLAHKDELKTIFKKQPAMGYANNAYVNNGVVNNYPNNNYVNNDVNNNYPNNYPNNYGN